MRTMPAILSIALAAAFLAVTSDVSQAKGERRNRDRVARDFMHADQDGDRRISRDEWNRRGNFDRLDADGDGFLSLREVRAMYRGHDDKDYDWPPAGMAKPTVEIDPSIAADRVEVDALDNETKCGIGRMMRCATADQKKRGLFETGTGPHFPDGAVCPGIDDYWAMDYDNKRNRESYHGGIDVPVPWGTPVRAVADGSVVAMYRAEQSKRGTEVVLRHGPEQTGLPVWTYSAYGHLDALPDLKIGQRVRMGQILAPTGNSGIAAMGTRGSDQSATPPPGRPSGDVLQRHRHLWRGQRHHHPEERPLARPDGLLPGEGPVRQRRRQGPARRREVGADPGAVRRRHDPAGRHQDDLAL